VRNKYQEHCAMMSGTIHQPNDPVCWGVY